MPHPRLWPDPGPGQQARAFDGVTADDPRTPRRTPGKVRAAWSAVAVIVLGAVVIGVAFVITSIAVGMVGVVIALVGVAVAVRSRIMSVATVGQSPEGSDRSGAPGDIT